MDRSPGLEAMRGDSFLKGCEFESEQNGYFFTSVSCKICNVCLKGPKIRRPI